MIRFFENTILNVIEPNGQKTKATYLSTEWVQAYIVGENPNVATIQFPDGATVEGVNKNTFELA
jgi:hypothetical protein